MERSSTDFKAVILAGGSGERFWPLSTPEKPKQFLKVFGGESLIRQAVTRLDGLVEMKNVFVVTAESLVAASREELPEIPEANFIGEPCRRDTAAAVATGVAAAGDGVVGVFAADQLVADPEKFRAAVGEAIRVASSGRHIVTLGIRPTFPATGFGYIDPKRGTFVEKPDEFHAREYIERGYLWNAGMFIAKYSTFRDAFATHAPALLKLFASPGEAPALYPSLPRISFDFAVMEKYDSVSVVAVDCGWDDVGSYHALAKYHPELVDDDGNLVTTLAQPIKLLGVRNLVVVATKDGILVADKSRLGDMKKLFRK